MKKNIEKEITLAGGCFWGVEKYLGNLRGILSTEVGYANGVSDQLSYEEVCSGETGAAEAVRLRYNPALLPLSFLLEQFYLAIDPASINRQGNDVGTQYRTGIYYTDAADRPVIETSLKTLEQRLGRPVAIEVQPLERFATAEAYHQKYLDKNPQGYCHISPALFARARQAGAYIRPDEDALRRTLTPLQYEVTQRQATEPPFTGEYDRTFAPGLYVDITTGQPLFLSADKFDAGCGWPAFARPVDPGAVREARDASHGMRRTEVRSQGGDAHLGHVFTDGPAELGGLRYCINSAALRFVPKADMAAQGYGDLVSLLED